ncbi:MAG: hypothetical protein ACOC53_03350 [Candidatus Saliniplasma sp.]
MDISKFLERFDQEDYDRWVEGRSSICDLIEKHKLTALLFKRKILNAIDEHEPKDLVEKFCNERPDIDIRNEEMVLERVEEELEDIKRAL